MTDKQKTVPGKYTLIPRVLVFPFDLEGKVLLLKGASSKKIWADVWNGPGGHVERGETPVQAARRELREETGLEAGTWMQAAEVVVDTGKEQGILFWVFKAQHLSGDLVASDEGELAWLSIEEALELDLVEDLYTLLPLVAKFRDSDKPLWGSYSYDADDQLIMRFQS